MPQNLHRFLFYTYIYSCTAWLGYEEEIKKLMPAQVPEIGDTFVWETDNNLKIPENWNNKDIPCDGDCIRIDPDKEIVAMVEDGLKASLWQFPNDGIILFADKTVIGRKGKWQCPRRKSPEDVFYQPPGILGNFLNMSKWRLLGEDLGLGTPKPRLHCEMVPSQEDEAIFPSKQAFQVQIDHVISVKKLRYDTEYQTTDSINDKILTIEGQYVFQLGPNLRVDRDFDGIEYHFPREIIMKINSSSRNKAGNQNWNSKPEILKDLCSYYTCEFFPEKYCTNLIKPEGHCCHTCAAIMTFRMHDLNFAWARDIIKRIESFICVQNDVHDMGIRLTRLDENDAYPLYQIAVFPEYAENYDESIFYHALTYAATFILYGIDLESPIHTDPQIEYSFQRNKIRSYHILIFLAVLLICFGMAYALFRYEYQHNFRFRSWCKNSQAINQMTVFYRQAKDFAEDRVDLLLNREANEQALTSFAPEDLNVVNSESEIVQEVVHSEFSNQAFVNEITDDSNENQHDLKEEEPTVENLIDIDF